MRFEGRKNGLSCSPGDDPIEGPEKWREKVKTILKACNVKFRRDAIIFEMENRKFVQTCGNVCGAVACGIVWDLLSKGAFDMSTVEGNDVKVRKAVVRKFKELVMVNGEKLSVKRGTHSKDHHFTGMYVEEGLGEDSPSVL